MNIDLPEQSRVIGGQTYTVQPLATRQSLQVMTRVLRMAGPSFGDVASLAQAASALGELFAGFATNLDEEVILFVCDAFAEASRVEIAPGRALPLATRDAKGLVRHYDDHFRGRPVEMFEWLRFAAEVSFGPLVDAARAKMLKAPEAENSPAAPGVSPAAA